MPLGCKIFVELTTTVYKRNLVDKFRIIVYNTLMVTETQIKEYLKDKGFKATKHRYALLQIMFSNKKPLSVPEILDLFEDLKLSPNKTTIYREIEFLIQEKILVEVIIGGDKKRYELASLEHHHHLICNNCESISDIKVNTDLNTIQKQLEKDNNFKIKSHTLEFYGLCSNCH